LEGSEGRLFAAAPSNLDKEGKQVLVAMLTNPEAGFTEWARDLNWTRGGAPYRVKVSRIISRLSKRTPPLTKKYQGRWALTNAGRELATLGDVVNEGKPIGRMRETKNRERSLLSFLACRGGIRSDDPLISDLRSAIGESNKFIPGFGKLIRKPKQISTAAKSGGCNAPMSLDSAREAAAEAGYIHETTTLAEFIDAIDQEIRGRHIYEGRAP
jgi:hypothetical protein